MFPSQNKFHLWKIASAHVHGVLAWWSFWLPVLWFFDCLACFYKDKGKFLEISLSISLYACVSNISIGSLSLVEPRLMKISFQITQLLYIFKECVPLLFNWKNGHFINKETRIHYCKWVYKIHKSELRWMCLTILGLNITFQLKGTNHREKLKRSSKLSTKTLLFYEQSTSLGTEVCYKKERTWF